MQQFGLVMPACRRPEIKNVRVIGPNGREGVIGSDAVFRGLVWVDWDDGVGEPFEAHKLRRSDGGAIHG